IVPYLTLSHCWGSSAHLQLKRMNYVSFLTPNKDSNLTKTYRDAFRVTVSLEFRFLWIDSLCIIQDDLEDWRTQSLKMGAIYSNAHCNIAATWASDGGDGCFNKRDPFTVTPTTIGLSLAGEPSREFQISGHYTYDEDINNAPLNRRAWVVQERYLAQRQLSFAKNQVYWECREVTASEQFPVSLPQKNEIGPPKAKPSLYFDSVQEFRHGWCSLVETYSDCHLTRPSDKTIALAGLVSHFRDITGDTYLAGLWKTDLREQLCWRYAFYPYYSDDRQRNRSRTLSYYAPTWSWASFNG
ncbi:HET-domain-containing protein, partial [Hyaloscypha variabilis F]